MSEKMEKVSKKPRIKRFFTLRKINEKHLRRLFLNDIRSPNLSPYRAKYFICKNGCNCPKTTEILRQVGGLKNLHKLISTECWHFILNPLILSVTPSTCLDPQTLKELLYSIKAIKNLNVFWRVLDLIKYHGQLHPPCRQNMKEYYQRIFLESENYENHSFSNIINDITYYFMNVKIEGTHHRNDPLRFREEFKNISSTRCKRIIVNSPKQLCSSKNSELLPPLTYDEVISRINLYATCGDYSSLPEFNSQHLNEKNVANDREVEIIQVFAVFQIMLDLLEHDLYIWLQNCHLNFAENMQCIKKWPLVARIAWQNDVPCVGTINVYCRNIFNLFKICPRQQKYMIARYICLLAEIARASEENKEKLFPYFGVKCEAFSNELSAIISTDTSKIELVEMIELLCPHWLKFIVSNYLLDAALSSPTIYSLLSSLRILQRNLSYDERSGKIDTPKQIKEVRKKSYNRVNCRGETLLHKLCRKNHAEKLEKLLKFDDCDVNIQDYYGWSPLHEASKHNAIDCIKLLVNYRLPPFKNEKPLEVNIRSENGVTPLMDAIVTENIDVINLLAKFGASTTIYNKCDTGLSALDLAEGNVDIKNVLLNAWYSSISSYNYLNMDYHDIRIFQNLLFSYCKIFHTKEAFLNQKKAMDANIIDDYDFNINFQQHIDDAKHCKELFELILRLFDQPPNKNILNIIFIFIKSFIN